MSLRSRLVAGFLAIAIALLGADVGVAVLVRHSLISATDRRLEIGRAGARPDLPAQPSHPVRTTGKGTATGNAAPLAALPRNISISDLYVAYVTPSGAVQSSANDVGRHDEPPKVTKAVLAKATPFGQTPTPFSLGAVGGGYGYRAIALKTSSGGVLVIAVSLKDTEETFYRVLLVEAIAGLLVLALLALVAWWILHLGVRPLDRMAQTADAIAEGDLSRRVDRAEPRTEVGRLGLALNSMLGEIETAFDERRASEERLRRFAADASHELRTPLTSIRGYAELWRQGGITTDDELTDAMRRMEQEAARMGVLVDDLLLLARLDQGRPLERSPVDLAVLARDAVADAQAAEPERPLSLTCPDSVMLRGDEGRLRQVLANLLANEWMHTPPGTPVRVQVTLDATMVTIVVEDDGPGLGPEPERVFERFYRADPARARASGGTGLGLSIVHSVVEAHGGHASAGACPSGGARVTITLPLEHQDATRPVPEAQFA